MSSAPWSLAVVLALVAGCGETSLGALRRADAGPVDVPRDGNAADAAPSLRPLRCEEPLPDEPDAVREASVETRARLREDRDVAVVERWTGGDSLADGAGVSLVLPGGRCAGGAAIVGFRESPRAGEAGSGTGCVPGLSTVSSIELGYNDNYRGACVHGEGEGGPASRVLRLLNSFWRPEEVLALPAGEARCAFGVTYSAVVLAAPDGVRWSRLLDQDYRLNDVPISLDAAPARLSPVATSWAARERWGLWVSPDRQWFAEQSWFSGGTLSLQDLASALGGLGASDLLDTRPVAPGLLTVVRSPRGIGDAIGAVLLCPGGPPHVRRLVAGVAVVARLVRRGDGVALVWQTDDADGLSRLWVTEHDHDFTTRTPPHLIEEGAGLALVDVTVTDNPAEVVLWYVRRGVDGARMLRTGRLVFGL